MGELTGKWRCSVCGYVYDEAREGIAFADLPADWTCPRCGAPKSAFVRIAGEEKSKGVATTVAEKIVEQLVVFNDGKLKNIGKEQDEYGFPQYAIEFPNPGFAQMARTAGGLGIRVEEPGRLDDAIREALASPKPALVEVIVAPEVYIKAVRSV